MKGIPKIIHLLFLNKQEAMPEIFISCRDRIKAMHPTWTVTTYNEDDAIRLLKMHFPSLLPVYSAYQHIVQRADLLRVVLVYLFGGFYMDLDMYALKPLDELLDFELVLGEEKIITMHEKIQAKLKHRQRIANYMFGSTPHHPFWLAFLTASFKKVSDTVTCENDVLETTGPGLLTNVYHRHRRTFPDITLLRNKDRYCLIPGHQDISCHFGNFAAHLHSGTWRTNVKENLLHVGKIAGLKSLVKEITGLYKDRSQPYEGLYLSADGQVNDIYTAFRKILPVSTPDLSGKTIVHCTDPNHMTGLHTDDANQHVLVYIPDSVICYNGVQMVNAFFDLCIVLHLEHKHALEKAGITVPVKVVEMFYQRPERYSNSDASEGNTFVVYSHANMDADHNAALAAACDDLRANKIPGLQLCLESITTRHLQHAHCSIYPASAQGISYGLSSLYLGIPVILYYEHNPPDPEICRYCHWPAIADHDPVKISNAILHIFERYTFYNQQALDAATAIEDKWSLESAVWKILRLLKHKLPAHANFQ